MNNRVVQIVLFAVVGACLAWLLMREDEAEPAVARTAVVRPVPIPAEPAQSEPTSSAAPPKVVFQLPKMTTAKADVAPPPPKPTTIQTPNDWFLRGSASKNYELRSDRATAFTGNYSAVLISHDKDVSPNLSGSGIQVVLAEPYVGKRIELSAMLRGENMRNAGSVWMYVTDPSRVIIAYQITQMSPAAEPSEWTRYRVVMDVPFHGEVLAYGFTLKGKGKLWVDDVHLRAVDTAVAVTGPQTLHQIGVIAQAVSVDGARAYPGNLDFEDVQITRERQPPPPRDEINATRF
jgi:hypothetical protein